MEWRCRSRFFWTAGRWPGRSAGPGPGSTLGCTRPPRTRSAGSRRRSARGSARPPRGLVLLVQPDVAAPDGVGCPAPPGAARPAAWAGGRGPPARRHPSSGAQRAGVLRVHGLVGPVVQVRLRSIEARGRPAPWISSLWSISATLGGRKNPHGAALLLFPPVWMGDEPARGSSMPSSLRSVTMVGSISATPPPWAVEFTIQTTRAALHEPPGGPPRRPGCGARRPLGARWRDGLVVGASEADGAGDPTPVGEAARPPRSRSGRVGKPR
jgi:hypothetical protein